jgi:hypothetical protein
MQLHVTRLRRWLCALALLPVLADGAAASPELRGDLRDRALAAFARVEASGRVHNRVLTVIDYSLPSSQKRLWVLDPDSGRILFHEFVAHGRGSAPESDPDLAVRFGNQQGSRRSSLGTFLTGDTYEGQHGHSLLLEGLDPGVNDRALARRIVIHPAAYVSESFRRQSGGRLGRSFGCPALDPLVAGRIIDRIRGGSVIFAVSRE